MAEIIRLDPHQNLTAIHFESGCHGYWVTQAPGGGGPRAPGLGSIGELGPSGYGTAVSNYNALTGAAIQDVGIYYGPAVPGPGDWLLLIYTPALDATVPAPPDPGFPVNEGGCWP